MLEFYAYQGSSPLRAASGFRCLYMNIRGLVATRAPAIQTTDAPRDAFDEDAFMTEYDIRVAEPHDLLSVARLIERRPDFTTRHLTGTQRETWARVMRTDGLTVYLARRADDAIGTTALLAMPHISYSCRPTAFLESMYVRENTAVTGLRG